MNQNLQTISETIKNNEFLPEAQKATIAALIKNTDALITLLEFKLGRADKEKKTSLILLQETIDELQQKTTVIEETNKVLTSTIEDLKHAQEQLVMSEKMASLGQLTAGIAHEINNPINFVSANIEPLQEDMADILGVISRYESIVKVKNLEAEFGDVEAYKKKIKIDFTKQEIEDLLNGIKEGAARTSEIVKGLRNFSRLDQNALKKANVNDCIESTLTVLHSAYKDRVEIVRDFGSVEDIDCYPGQINQVLMNILSNAIQAIPDTGTITVRTWQKDGKVMIAMTDTGTGMTEEVRKKIFDPFFTTKDVGKGTGLGLSISYGIIEKHGGKIDVATELNKGTTFTITLPIYQEP